MSVSDLINKCSKLGIRFGEGAAEYAPVLDELEERLWLAQENDENPPPWVQIMKAAVERKLASVMETT